MLLLGLNQGHYLNNHLCFISLQGKVIPLPRSGLEISR